MKLRHVLGGAVGAVGLTAVANRLLAARATNFEPFLDGEDGTYRWRGFDIAYTELGDPENDDVILFHGISAASSNHEFDRVAERLREDHHVIVPDLPGFGHSDRPPLLYSTSLYITFVADAIEDLSDDAPIVVGSSLSSAYAALATEQVSVEKLVLACPTDSTMPGPRPWVRALLRSPVIGQGLFNLMVNKPGIRYFQQDHGYYDTDNFAPDVLEYEWQTAHQPGARYAPASFVGGFLDPDQDIGDALAGLDVPVTFVWGRQAGVSPLSEGRDLAERADAGLVVFDRAKLLPHVEHPDAFVDVIAEEVAAEQ